VRKPNLGGRPPIPEDQKRRRIEVTLSPAAIVMLDDIRQNTGASRSHVVEQLLREAATKKRTR
jgi:metal-responsive CopG/Arc/MetJ family transcriptional regulator